MRPILPAIAAALLFGVTTPIAKALHLAAFELAGLLYLGAGLGLVAIRCIRDRGWTATGLERADLKWLVGVILHVIATDRRVRTYATRSQSVPWPLRPVARNA